MKAAIVVGTRDASIRKFFSDRQEAAIPANYRGRENGVFSSVKLYCFDPENEDGRSFGEDVLRIGQGYDAVACMVSATDYDLVADCGHAFFVAFFQEPEWKQNFFNFFSSHICSWMKNFIFLAKAHENLTKYMMLILPKHTFVSAETASIEKQLNDNTCNPIFVRHLQDYYAAVYARRSPKKKGSSGPERYFVDDKRYYFRFGHEEHAEAEEGAPHVFACRSMKYFFFGMAIIDKRHFNTSEEKPNKKIHVTLLDCHGEERSYGPHSHLNVFPNGFID